MTEFLLVRHGETVWNLEGRMQGQQDSPLSAQGLAQAQLIAQRLRHERVDHLYSSDLGRAYHTAQAIAQAIGQPVQIDLRLRERNNGIFEGLTLAETQARYPEIYQAYATATADFAMPGGESHVALQDRALAVFTELAQRHPDERVIVVSHGGLLSTFLRYVLNLAWLEPHPFRLANASLSHVRFAPATQTWRSLSISDVTHLQQGA